MNPRTTAEIVAWIPGVVDQRPGQNRQRRQQQPLVEAALRGHREQDQRHQREGEEPEVEVVGEEEGDNEDADEVVDDGQGQQEHAQPLWQMRSDHGEDGDREGDVGGRRDRPP